MHWSPIWIQSYLKYNSTYYKYNHKSVSMTQISWDNVPNVPNVPNVILIADDVVPCAVLETPREAFP